MNEMINVYFKSNSIINEMTPFIYNLSRGLGYKMNYSCHFKLHQRHCEWNIANFFFFVFNWFWFRDRLLLMFIRAVLGQNI